jgi:hypothetical protein
MDQELKLDLSFKDEDSKQAMSILEEVGASNLEEIKQRGMTGIEIVIFGVLATSALGNLVIKLTPLWKCGIIVDARESPVVTKKDSALPRGSVLVISKDGVQTKLDRPTDIQIAELIKAAVTSG